jgi:serine/threonine protein phosphatase PrpC
MQKTSARREIPWRALGASVRGALHVRDELPNQDALASWISNDPGAPVAIVTVADGHGGARHFRSAVGARLAVDVSLEVLREMAARFDGASEAERARITAVDVPLRIVKAWTDAVHAHLAAHPISDDEWSALNAADGAWAVDMVRHEPLFAYGATLLAALVTERCIVLTQLGDGDILVVDADGLASRPVPSDERLVGNLTTSLCRSDASSDFRCAVLSLDRELPLVLLCTDGYANSFRSDADFLQVGPDVLELIRRNGIAVIGDLLPPILDYASRHGSGDDITLGLIYRTADAEHAGAAVQRSSRDDRESTDPTRHHLSLAQSHVRSLKRVLAIALLMAAVAIGWSVRDYLLAPFAAVRDPGKTKSPSSTPPR